MYKRQSRLSNKPFNRLFINEMKIYIGLSIIYQYNQMFKRSHIFSHIDASHDDFLKQFFYIDAESIDDYKWR